MKNKLVNGGLLLFAAVAIASVLLEWAGRPVPGLTKIALILMMVMLIINSALGIKSGKDKSLYIIILVVAVLAILVNIAPLIQIFMG